MEEAFPARLIDPADLLVLIVDDEEGIRSLVEINLKKEGFQTVCAGDGAEALTKLEPRAPDLIFLDLMMPGQSGYEFLRHLQAAGHSRIPVVISTARSLDSSTVGVILQETNVVGFFPKPFNWPMILDAVHKRLNTRRSAPPLPDASKPG
jgi:CheY-like chemotaxis protein